VTLKEIATIAGVSIKTASRAINGYPDISKATRERILEIARTHHYLPNNAARSLRQNRSCTIGLVVPDLTNLFFGEVGRAVHNHLKPSGYSTLISFSEGSHRMEIDALDSLVAKQVDGIILATVGSTADHVQLIRQHYRIPVVVIDNILEGADTDLVLHDDMANSKRLTEHLCAQGCRSIGFISGPLAETSGAHRHEGFLQAMATLELPVHPTQVVTGDWTVQGGRRAAMELLDRCTSGLDGIITANSLMALGLYAVLRERDLRIPHDIAVASFDYLELVDALDPPLTTLSRVDSKIGLLAAQRLQYLIDNPEEKGVERTLVTAELQVRQSSVRVTLT